MELMNSYFRLKKNPNHICSYLTEKEKNNLNKSLKNIFFEKGNHMEKWKKMSQKLFFIDK